MKSTNDSQTSNYQRRRFTKDEDDAIRRLIASREKINWQEIASHVPGRTARQCRDRYNTYLFKDIVSKPWTEEEDKIIIKYYQIFGPHWVRISSFLYGRSGNNVKNRWYKFLAKYNDVEPGSFKQKRRSKHEKWKKEKQNRPPDTTIQETQVLLDKEFMMGDLCGILNQSSFLNNIEFA